MEKLFWVILLLYNILIWNLNDFFIDSYDKVIYIVVIS